MLFHKRTKLTGMIDSLDERFPMNHAVWATSDDLKICYAHIRTRAAVGAVLLNSSGITSIAYTGAGICKLTFAVEFDAVPLVIVQALTTNSDATDIPQACVSDGVAAGHERSTTEQTLLRFATNGVAANGDWVVLIIGTDAGTTAITDNSDTTPLIPDTLNRFVAIGDYRTPLDDDVVAMLSGAYTETDANAGDTISSNISNLADADHTRNGAGDYTTDLTNVCIDAESMFPLICPITNNALQAGSGTSTVNDVTAYITNGINSTNADGNYCIMLLGMAEVA